MSRHDELGEYIAKYLREHEVASTGAYLIVWWPKPDRVSYMTNTGENPIEVMQEIVACHKRVASN